LKFNEPTLKSEVIFNGNVVKLRVDTVKLINGNEATREVIEHPGGVAILPVDENGYAYVVTQFRKPIDDVLIEAPAGKLSIGEGHYECGVRELEEETGFRAGKITYLGFIIPTPGYTNEKIYLYLAQDLSAHEQNLDEDEFLSVQKIHFNDLVKMCINGEISDGKTISLVFRANEIINK